MALEVIDWGGPPSIVNGDDGPTYVLGCAFTVDEPVPCSGIRWRVPDVLAEPAGGTYWVSLWEGSTRVRNQSVTPVAGGDQDFAHAEFTCTPGNEYTAQVMTRTYSASTGGGYPYSTPSGVAQATEGRLSTSSDPTTRASGASAARFYVSPIVGTADPGVEASMALTMPALAAQLNAGAGIGAAVSLALPALDLAIVGDVSGPEPVEDVMTMAAVMDEIAAVLRAYGGWKTVHAQPPASVAAVPAAIVGYPEDVTYQLTMGRNALERYQRLAVHAIVGRIPGSVATNRARVSRWTTGSQSIRVALETHTWQSCDTVHVGNAEIGMIDFNGVDYLQVTFFIDINGLGG